MPVWLMILIAACVGMLIGAWFQRQYDIAERKLDAQIAAATHRVEPPTVTTRCIFTVGGSRCDGWSGHPGGHFGHRILKPGEVL